MMTSVVTSTALRPTLSPKWPKNTAPTGRSEEADPESSEGRQRPGQRRESWKEQRRKHKRRRRTVDEVVVPLQRRAHEASDSHLPYRRLRPDNFPANLFHNLYSSRSLPLCTGTSDDDTACFRVLSAGITSRFEPHHHPSPIRTARTPEPRRCTRRRRPGAPDGGRVPRGVRTHLPRPYAGKPRLRAARVCSRPWRPWARRCASPRARKKGWPARRCDRPPRPGRALRLIAQQRRPAAAAREHELELDPEAAPVSSGSCGALPHRVAVEADGVTLLRGPPTTASGQRS